MKIRHGWDKKKKMRGMEKGRRWIKTKTTGNINSNNNIRRMKMGIRKKGIKEGNIRGLVQTE